MSGGGRKPTLPPIAAPIPTPEELNIEALQKGEAIRRRLRARKGRRGTILTEITGIENIAAQKSTILSGEVV